MPKIAIAQAYSPIEVDLWGTDFQTRDVTRSGAKMVGEIEEKLDALDAGDNDNAVDLIGQILDVKLVNSNGSRTKPSTIIKRKWEADQLSAAQLFSFLRSVAEAEAEARPT